MGAENNIDYRKLMQAIDYYTLHGFQYINLPWLVSENISSVTRPDSCQDFFINKEVLVASGEQSFLQLIKDQKLAPGRYMGLTPCFRDEKVLDELHCQYFMKVELIDTLNPTEKSLDQIIELAINFFQQYLPCEVVQMIDSTYDIVDIKNQIELGSYGIRQTFLNENPYQSKLTELKWIYATGCAEPRLTTTMNL